METFDPLIRLVGLERCLSRAHIFKDPTRAGVEEEEDGKPQPKRDPFGQVSPRAGLSNFCGFSPARGQFSFWYGMGSWRLEGSREFYCYCLISGEADFWLAYLIGRFVTVVYFLGGEKGCVSMLKRRLTHFKRVEILMFPNLTLSTSAVSLCYMLWQVIFRHRTNCLRRSLITPSLLSG